MKICPSCKTENLNQANFCTACGKDFSENKPALCPICGFENPLGARLCRKCKYSFSAIPLENQRNRENAEKLRDGEKGCFLSLLIFIPIGFFMLWIFIRLFIGLIFS